jgi:hypothetical protein
MSKAQPGAGYGFTSSGYGFSLNTLDPFPIQEASAPDHPFKVSAIFGTNATDLRLFITAGAINNIVPAIYGGNPTDPLLNAIPQPYSVIAGGTGTIYDIYIRAGRDATFGNFPTSDRSQNGYPQVWYETDPTGPKADTDTYGYICLARLTVDNATLSVISVQQYVTGSLWASRIKVGDLTAQYFYARV